MICVANIATHAGREVTIERTLASIIHQFDEINIYDNEVEDINLTDRGKFAFIDKYDEPVYYFTLDDDIIYPADYVDRTVYQIERQGGIITYHGRQLLGEGRNYYRGHKSYHLKQGNDTYVQIDVPGTGVTAWRTDYFKPRIEEMKQDKMVDLLFGLQAARLRKHIHLGLKPQDWLIIQPLPFERTIYGQEVMKCEKQNKIADSICRLRGVRV